MFVVLVLTIVGQVPQSTLGAPPQSTLGAEWPAPVASRAAVPSGLSVFTTSKGVELQRRVDPSGNVQIDFPGGDSKDFSSPTVYERAKARLQAASALAPVTPAMAPMAAPMAPVAPASSLGGPAPAMGPATQPPAYAPPAPVQAAPASSWQPLTFSPGYEAYGTVGPDGVWYYDPASVRPMGGGWVAQAQPAPVNYSAPAVSYAPPAVSYSTPAYYAAPASSPCGPYGCSVSGGSVGGFYGASGPRGGGVLGFGVFGRR